MGIEISRRKVDVELLDTQSRINMLQMLADTGLDQFLVVSSLDDGDVEVHQSRINQYLTERKVLNE